MYDDELNNEGIKRLPVFVIGVLGVLNIIFGLYRLYVAVTYEWVGRLDEPNFKFVIITYGFFILLGIFFLFLANRLLHRLLPTADDIETRNKRKEKTLMAREAKIQAKEAFEREKRAKLAQEWAAKYNELQHKKEEEQFERLKVEFATQAINQNNQSTDGPISFPVELHFFEKPFVLLNFIKYGGAFIAAATTIYGIHHIKYMETIYSRPQDDNKFYLFLFITIVFFWIGLILWIIGGNFKFSSNNCCIANRNGQLYIVYLKRERIAESLPVKGFFSHGVVGKLVNSIATIVLANEYHNKLLANLKAADFNETVRRMIEEGEYNSLVDVMPLNKNNKKIDKWYVKYITRKYYKEKMAKI